jgi:hypothetical protein
MNSFSRSHFDPIYNNGKAKSSSHVQPIMMRLVVGIFWPLLPDWKMLL